MKNKNIFKFIAGIVLIGMISWAGCQKMEIVKLIGFVQGHVFDGTTNEPLDGVKVEWLVAGKKDSTTVTADNGYLIPDLPVGSYSIWFSKENYTTIVADVDIEDNNTSSVAVRGGENIEQVVTLDANLYPLNASIKGRVYLNDNGVNVPAQGVVLMLDYNTSDAEQDEYFRFVPNIYTDTTDADGYFNISNVPATKARFIVKPYTDDNGKQYIGYYNSGWSIYYNSWDVTLDNGITSSLGNIIMEEQSDDIHLINTNLWTSADVPTQEFPVADNITLSFNKNVDETATLEKGNVSLYSWDDVTSSWRTVAITVTFTDNIITVDPDQDLSENKRYMVSYNVYSVQGYDDDNGSITFKTVNNTTIPAQVGTFEINYVYMGNSWVADYNTTGIWFTIGLVEGAEKYEIYARDSYHNSEYIKIREIIAPDYIQGEIPIWVSLISYDQFDYYYDDGVQTPFSHGTVVSYKIRAVNSAGAGEFSNVVDVSDETPFTDNDIDIVNTQSNSANNTAGSSTLTITMYFSIMSARYADVSVIPTVKLFNGGTEITPFNATVTWISSYRGEITFEVPANTDYSNMELRLYGITDSSGNPMDPADYEAETLY